MIVAVAVAPLDAITAMLVPVVAVVAVAIVAVAVCLSGRVVAGALWCRGVAAVAVAPGRRLGCGVRCLCVAVVWLRHADEY